MTRRVLMWFACVAALSLAAVMARAEFRLVSAIDPPDGLAGPTRMVFAATPSQTAEAKPAWTAESPVSPPDLDLGWNDFLELRIAVPVGAVGSVRLEHGTSERRGFAAERGIELPRSVLLRDGLPHTYRLDLGLEVFWRDRLTDLRITAPSGSSLLGVDVGDLPNDVLEINEDINIFVGDADHKPETRGDLQKMESKHFVYWWSPMSYVSDKGFDPNVMPRRALRMSEETYQVVCKLHGYREPFVNGEPARRDGKRRKVNITSWYGGTWMGAQNGWTYYNIPGWGLRDEGWGNPVPHELAHAVQGAQPGFLNGAFWESHANYLRELRNRHFRALMPGYKTTLERGVLSQSCVLQDHQRFIYADYRIHMMLDEIGPQIGLGSDASARLWTEGPREMTAWAKLGRLLPKGRSLKDVACLGLSRFATLDFADGAVYRDALRGSARETAAYERACTGDLLPCPARKGWWRVAWARAPMPYGFMVHTLAPTRGSRSITVDLRGVGTPGDGEDWRWRLIAIGAASKPRYSPVWAPGRRTFALLPGEQSVKLFVIATPNDPGGSPAGSQDRYPLDRQRPFVRYPYEVRIEGATPAHDAYIWPSPAGRAHPNGGGFVAATAHVDPSAFVARGARVLDRARVLGQARVLDQALISDDAAVSDRAVVSGSAWVGGTSQVRDRAHVGGRATLKGASIVRDDARVQDHAVLTSTVLADLAIARGNATPWDARVGGHAILDYDYSMAFNLSDGVHFNHIPWGGWFDSYWAQTLRKPRGLLCSYRFEQPDGSVCWDEFGGLHAILRGSPRVAWDSAHRSRALLLSAEGQWLELDPAICDARALTVSLWWRSRGGHPDAPLVTLGRPDGPMVRLLGPNAQGRLTLRVKQPGAPEVVLRSVSPSRRDAWSYVALSLDGTRARLIDNIGRVAETPCSLAPLQLTAPYRSATPTASLIGANESGQSWTGSIADVRVFADALSREEIAADRMRSGDLLARQLEAAQPIEPGTPLESGIRNGRKRTLAAWLLLDPEAPADRLLPVFDSRDERDASRGGAGFGIRSGRIVARIDGMGEWETGVQIGSGQWTHVALAFDGRIARICVGGREAASRSYMAGSAQPSTKNYRIGYMQTAEDPASRAFFTGSLRDVRIYATVLSAAEVAATMARTPAGESEG